METHAASLVSLHALARRLGVSPKWLRAEALAGRIPALKAERRLLFNPAAVERELVKRAAATTPTSEGANHAS